MLISARMEYVASVGRFISTHKGYSTIGGKTMKQKGHKRGLTCDKCGDNLKGMYHYNKTGAMVRAHDLFYCNKCEVAYKIEKQELGGKTK